MKRSTFYIITLVLAAIILLLLLNNNSRTPEKKLDQRVTFSKDDKIPYGTFIAYDNLRHLFPEASISADSKKPGYWDSLKIFDPHQLLLVISPQFYPEVAEMEKLIRFAGAGNTVFISTQRLSYAAQEKLNCVVTDRTMPYNTSGEQQRLVVGLSQPTYTVTDTFSYPGKSEIAWFDRYDTAVSQVMGMHSNGYPNFLRMRTGRGQIFLQISPFTFTNYFLLHRRNINYYDQLLSAIRPQEVRKVVWDEYFLKKKYLSGDSFNNETSSSSSGKNWFSTLMDYRPFRYAFWVMILVMIAYVLIEMRRKQRHIPVINKLRNDSLDFVKTIGRLYHQKKDHKNLAQKMSAYFLEHIRGQYKLPTNRLDDDFVKALHYKSGYDEKELYFLVRFIRDIPALPALSDQQLVDFQRRLEHFYGHT